MPNGGSDCCGTCWFNAKNRGEPGYGHADSREPDHCMIRDLPIKNAFYTYCANHPHRNPNRLTVPIGPVFTGDSNYNRELWQPSPDTETIREALLELLGQIPEEPQPEYPFGAYIDDVVVWQLGEFRERRAIPDLQRIAAFDPETIGGSPLPRDRSKTVNLAREALAKIESQEGG